MLDSEIVDYIEADVFDFQIQKDKQGEYTYFHTDIFDIIIHYINMKIEKNWKLKGHLCSVDSCLFNYDEKAQFKSAIFFDNSRNQLTYDTCLTSSN